MARKVEREQAKKRTNELKSVKFDGEDETQKCAVCESIELPNITEVLSILPVHAAVHACWIIQDCEKDRCL